MKKILLFLFIISFSDSFSQSYLAVYPDQKFENKDSNERGYENTVVFAFTADVDKMLRHERCRIQFRAVDSQGKYIPENNIIRALTGWNHEYVEDELKFKTNEVSTLVVSTNNLPKLFIVIWFDGPNDGVHLEDVTIDYLD